ncbi:MAG: hybrid sensor histidine kinase/response regulator [Gammaproteobacteria bacterium]|nr:hybrid sensor histidine kinase/response regulator [Gammaproteobacteria bacterium]
MLDLFKMELESQATVLGTGLLALDQGPPSASEIDELMRAAHSIKGAARILQFDPLVGLAHVMEDIFVAVQEGRLSLTAAHVDVLLAGADHFAQVAAQAEDDIPVWVDANVEALASTAALVEKLRDPDFGKEDSTPSVQGPVSIASETTTAETAPIEPVSIPQTDAPAAQTPSPVTASPVVPDQPGPQAVASSTSAAPAPTAQAPAAASPSAADNSRAGEGERFLRVSAENLSRVVGLAGECLVEARNLAPLVDRFQDLRAIQRDLLSGIDRWLASLPTDLPAGTLTEANRARETAKRLRADFTRNLRSLELAAQRMDDNAERLFREVLMSRMRPFEEGVADLSRMVRDLARQLGKKVRFQIRGKDTRVDRDILDKLKAPLTHIVRNALDHGLELPADRVAQGKPEEATITVTASHRAGMLALTVQDDGRGINPESLRKRIVERGLSDPETAAVLSTAELYDFLFLPGFSTAAAVTEVSGRGVGLDVVLSTVQEVSGTIRVDSEIGKGTSFQLQLPVTRSVLRALLVQIDGEPYAFPLARLDQSLRISRRDVQVLDNRSFLIHNGENVGLVSARQLLGRPAAEGDEDIAVVFVSDRDGRYGVVVDDFLGERTIVVHPLDRRLGKIRNISAASVMEDGSPLLIFDIDDLVRSADAVISRDRAVRAVTAAGAVATDTRKRILVVDDSLTVRELERRLLESRGYRVDVAVNGMDGWNAVRAGHYDLVVSDVDMPRMNGIQLVGLIKGDAGLASTPVVIVSYKDRPEDHALGLEAGADYYLAKSSFQDETLVRVVEDLIGAA